MLVLSRPVIIEVLEGECALTMPYVSVGGKWMYLYRAVDEHGKTVESYLSRTRDKAAAKPFFRKALKRHRQPRTITLDGFELSHSALRIMGMRNELKLRWENPVKIRCCPYLNNIVEQDHRRIKFRLQPMTRPQKGV